MPPATAPGGWVAATWTAAVLSALAALFTAVLAMMISAGATEKVITLGQLFGGLATLAMIFAALAWLRASRQTAQSSGVNARRYVFAWGFRVWGLCTVSGYAVQYLWDAADETPVAIGMLVRSLGAVALLADILTTRIRIRKLLAGLAKPSRADHTSTPADGIVPHPSDWDAAQWDPDVLTEIERRRHVDR